MARRSCHVKSLRLPRRCAPVHALPSGPQEIIVAVSLVSVASGALYAALRPSVNALDECEMCKRTGAMKCIVCDGSGRSEEPRKPSANERTLEKMGFYSCPDEYTCRACAGAYLKVIASRKHA